MAGDFANGLEFLKALREQTGKQEQSYKPFSRYLDYKAREKAFRCTGSLS